MMIYAMRFTACYRGEDEGKRKSRKMLEELRGSFINMRKLSLLFYSYRRFLEFYKAKTSAISMIYI